MFLLSSLCSGNEMYSEGGKRQLAKSSFFKSKGELRDWRTWKKLCAVRFCIFFLLLVLWLSLIQKFWVVHLRLYIPIHCMRTEPPHPQDVVVKTTDAGLLLLILYVLQLWWLKNTIHPNSMVSKQQDLFHPWICIVDRAHQGQLVSALPIVTEGWGWRSSLWPTRMAPGLGGPERAGGGSRWEQLGPSFCGLPVVSPALQGHCGLQRHVSRAGEACTLGKCRLGSWSGLWSPAALLPRVLSVEDIAMVHLVPGKGNIGPTAWWRSVCVSLIVKSSMWDGLCWWGCFWKI